MIACLVAEVHVALQVVCALALVAGSVVGQARSPRPAPWEAR